MHVLIADDDPGILQALELVLHRARITTARACSPEQVLQALDASTSSHPQRAMGTNVVTTCGRKEAAESPSAGPSLAGASCSERPFSPGTSTSRFDAVLLDLNYERDTTSGAEGMSLLSTLQARHPNVPAVVMTAWGSIEGAVEAMRRGAVDYVKKPWQNDKLLHTLRGLPSRRIRSKPPSHAASSQGTEQAVSLLSRAHSPGMVALLQTIEQVAFSDLPVLITGEHGTGKELVARAVHEKSGRSGAFIPVHAGALAEGTCESELFGHVRGAFTDAKNAREGAFARAAQGTLFLDEIATMPVPQQVKLLRVLQQRQYQPVGGSQLLESTARVVSATNVDLEELRASGAFRPDLLYRLNAIQLHLPPLRERKQELEGLSTYFLQREAERHAVPMPQLSAAALQQLLNHDWPGNVRELEHTLQRALLLSLCSGTVLPEHLQLQGSTAGPRAGTLHAPVAHTSTSHTSPPTTPDHTSTHPGAQTPPNPAAASLPDNPASTEATSGTLREAEKAAILSAIERFPNDRRAAAKSLGLSRSSFYRRLALYGIQPWK